MPGSVQTAGGEAAESTEQLRLTQTYVVLDQVNPEVGHLPAADSDASAPRPACEAAGSDDTSWTTVTGDGEIERRCQRPGCFGSTPEKEVVEMACGTDVAKARELNHRLQCDECEVDP